MSLLPRLSACRSVPSKRTVNGTGWRGTARTQIPTSAKAAASPYVRYPAGNTSSSAPQLAVKHGGIRISMRCAEKQSTPTLALIAANPSRHTATSTGSIALTHVMSWRGLEAVHMSDERFQCETRYQAALSIAKAILRRCLISREEFDKIDGFLLEKYCPPIGSLLAHGR